jgi:hypothetical protein
MFDELCHFTESQFWYLFSRNRSDCGVKPQTLGCCNPDPKSWVKKFIAWFLDPETGLPIQERCGKLRWFWREKGDLVWANSKSELERKYKADHPEDKKLRKFSPKSMTFIAGLLERDNKIFMEKNPDYLGNLLAQDPVLRAQLHDGNWNVDYIAGSMFKRAWFNVTDALPAGLFSFVRFWDLAASEPTPQNPDPDCTDSVKLGRLPDGRRGDRAPASA